MASLRSAFMLTILAFVGHARAHGLVTGVVADGIYYQGYLPEMEKENPVPETVGWRAPRTSYQGPVTPYTYIYPDYINCNMDATPAKKSATVSAGGTVNVQWTVWPEGHHGSILNYLAACSGPCASVDRDTLLWNKFQASGLKDETKPPGLWATDDLIANNNSQTVTIPNTLAPGEYVLRHEIIALQSADHIGGAQDYPYCVNLKVMGNGTNPLSSGTLGTDLYGTNSTGKIVNIYEKMDNYTIPGPPETI